MIIQFTQMEFQIHYAEAMYKHEILNNINGLENVKY